MTDLILSPNPPTEPGWYWMYEKHHDKRIVYVGREPTKQLLAIFESDCMLRGGGEWFPISTYRARWAGPIQEPKE